MSKYEFTKLRPSLCIVAMVLFNCLLLSCNPSKFLSGSDSKQKQAKVVATSDGGEFVIWSEKVGALQWDFDEKETNAVCFLTSYLSKSQIEAWKRKEEPLLDAYRALKKERNKEVRQKFFDSFKKDLFAIAKPQNPFKETKLDQLWPWMDREASGQLKDFEVILRHFGNFKSPIGIDQNLNHPLNEQGFRDFLEVKLNDVGGKLVTLQSKPLEEPSSGMSERDFQRGSTAADLTSSFIGTGTIWALLIASGGGALSGPLVPVFFLSLPLIIGGRSAWEGFNRHKTLSAKKALISAERDAQVKQLATQLAPQKLLFESLKNNVETVSESEAAEAENMSKKLNAAIELLIGEYAQSGANEEQLFAEWHSQASDLTDKNLSERRRAFLDRAAYFKNTKCPQDAGGETSLNNYFMVPANWM